MPDAEKHPVFCFPAAFYKAINNIALEIYAARLYNECINDEVNTR